ncbi:MAG: ribosome-associated translation inhibitor RaiA [Tannerella sp.]|jgi:putative sigma-54 modulation protein|nr:ribosome-associated translation inhibitor RaiA [Tannerella sp.]
MELTIKAIHFDATEKLESFIEKKVKKLDKFHDGIISAEVLLKVIKPETAKNKQAGIRIKIRNGECFAEKLCDTFEEAVDTATEALEKQLVKYKKKVRTKPEIVEN